MPLRIIAPKSLVRGLNFAVNPLHTPSTHSHPPLRTVTIYPPHIHTPSILPHYETDTQFSRNA